MWSSKGLGLRINQYYTIQVLLKNTQNSGNIKGKWTANRTNGHLHRDASSNKAL